MLYFRPAMNIDTEVLRTESHAEIGTLIERDAARIVERWCRMARGEQMAAQRVHYEVLRDELPALLQAMGHALRQDDDSGAAANRTVAKEHGEQRWEHGWSLTEVVRDYQ